MLGALRLSQCLCLLFAASLLPLAALGCKSDSPPTPPAATATGQATRSVKTGRPVLTLETDYLDVGSIDRGSAIERSVVLCNKGDAELIVRNVTSSCQCIAASVDGKNLPPGGKALLTIRVEPSNQTGRAVDKVGILSNDTAGPRILTVSYNVSPDIIVTPSKVYLGIVKPGQLVHKTVRVSPHKDSTCKVLYAMSNLDGLVGRVTKPEAAKDAPAAMEVEFKAPSKPGTYRGSLAITTVGPESITLTLPVVACVSDSVTITPAAVDFGAIQKGQPAEEVLEVKCRSGTRLQAATTRTDTATVTIGSGDASHPIPVRLAIKPDAPLGPFAAEIRIEFAGADQFELVVPFAGEMLAR